MMMRMPQPQFESLANHRSGMRLITLWAVGWRQPGGIYLWTHVSNLAITVPLINSLPKSVPGEQEFTDSDGLMMLVNSADPHSLRWLGSSKNKKTTTDNGTLPNVMIYMNRVSAGALSASTWSHAVRKLQLISGELYAAAPRICLPPLAHRVLRSAPVMLLKQNCRHISSEQSSWILPPPPQKRGENSARRRQHHNILSNLQQKKLIQQVSSHISPPRLDSFLWTNLMFTSMPLEGLACQWGRQHA